jgi:ABC-type multidrug transport system fused ATPase/permease subunit
MKSIEKWVDRVYDETDFGRSIATSLSGLVGLAVYLVTNDWVIAVFSTSIAFPIFRIISTGIDEKLERKKKRKINEENAQVTYDRLSNEEKEVINSYVTAGGSVLTWEQMNKQVVSFSAIESLLQREVLWTSTTADGLTETFALDSNIFDIANAKKSKSGNS